MKKVKITVLKCPMHEDIVERFGIPDAVPCDAHVEGQVYYTNGWQKPEGLCDNAWKSMMEYAMTLAHGGRGFYDNELGTPSIYIASCNDGFRPVSFLLEATDEDAPVFME